MHPIRIRLAFRILVKRGDLIKDGDGDTARYKYDGVWLIQERWVACGGTILFFDQPFAFDHLAPASGLMWTTLTLVGRLPSASRPSDLPRWGRGRGWVQIPRHCSFFCCWYLVLDSPVPLFVAPFIIPLVISQLLAATLDLDAQAVVGAEGKEEVTEGGVVVFVVAFALAATGAHAVARAGEEACSPPIHSQAPSRSHPGSVRVGIDFIFFFLS